MRIQVLISLAALVGGGCGQNKKSDGSSAPGGPPAAIPASFAPTAGSPSDASGKLSAYSGTVLTALRTDLGAGGAGLADATSSSPTSSVTIDTSIVSQSFPAGADCAAVAKLFSAQLSQFSSVVAETQGALGGAAAGATATATATSTGASTATSAATGSSTGGSTSAATGVAASPLKVDYGSLYDVQDVGTPADARFSFERKLTRKASSDPAGGLGSILAMVLPSSMDIEGGANATQAAFKLQLAWDITVPADAKSGTQASATTIQTASETFVDTAAETLSSGLSAQMAATGAASVNVASTALVTIHGGATPSLSFTGDVAGTSQGAPVQVHAEFSLTKGAGNAYVVTLKAVTNGTEADKSLNVTLAGGVCKVQ